MMGKLFITWDEPRTVVAIASYGDQQGNGWAFCSPEDKFDIRVGAALAMKRALHCIKGIDRKFALRQFYQEHPEIHPDHKRSKDYKMTFTFVDAEGNKAPISPNSENITITPNKTYRYLDEKMICRYCEAILIDKTFETRKGACAVCLNTLAMRGIES